MAMETAMVVIVDHHNPHDFPGGGGFSAFFDQEEEEQLLLEALDAELAQELQFQEALRASLMISSSEFESESQSQSPPAAVVDQTETAPSSPTPPAEEGNQIPPGPDLDSKWEAGESSERFCEICRERKEDHQVVRNVYEDDNGGWRCVCFDCINVNAGGNWVNGCPEKKGKTKKLLLKKKTVAPNYKDHHHSGASSSSNRRYFPANRPPPRVGSRSVCDVEEKLRMAKEEVRLLREKIQLQHQESMEAMDFQEQFFRDQIKSILEGRVDDDDNGKEENSADCNSGTSSVLEPEPKPEPGSRTGKHLNKGMQKIMGEIEKMRRK